MLYAFLVCLLLLAIGKQSMTFMASKGLISMIDSFSREFWACFINSTIFTFCFDRWWCLLNQCSKFAVLLVLEMFADRHISGHRYASKFLILPVLIPCFGLVLNFVWNFEFNRGTETVIDYALWLFGPKNSLTLFMKVLSMFYVRCAFSARDYGFSQWFFHLRGTWLYSQGFFGRLCSVHFVRGSLMSLITTLI